MNVITVEHGRSYPSSVDDLCSMPLLYCIFISGKEEVNKSQNGI